MVSDQNQNHDSKPLPTTNDSFSVYIVGCLVHAGCIDFRADAPGHEQTRLINAACIIKACLDQLVSNSVDYPALPFKW